MDIIGICFANFNLYWSVLAIKEPHSLTLNMTSKLWPFKYRLTTLLLFCIHISCNGENIEVSIIWEGQVRTVFWVEDQHKCPFAMFIFTWHVSYFFYSCFLFFVLLHQLYILLMMYMSQLRSRPLPKFWIFHIISSWSLILVTSNL